MVLCRSRDKGVPASFAAEAQSPVVIADETELPAAACTTVLRFGHAALPALQVGSAHATLCIVTSFAARPCFITGSAATRRAPPWLLIRRAALPRAVRRINSLQWSEAPTCASFAASWGAIAKRIARHYA